MGAIIVADVGGTRMRVAALPRSGIQPIEHQVAPTQAPKGSPFERFVTLINAIWPDESVEAISVATAGPLNLRREPFYRRRISQSGSISPSANGWLNTSVYSFTLGMTLTWRCWANGDTEPVRDITT